MSMTTDLIIRFIMHLSAFFIVYLQTARCSIPSISSLKIRSSLLKYASKNKCWCFYIRAKICSRSDTRKMLMTDITNVL